MSPTKWALVVESEEPRLDGISKIDPAHEIGYTIQGMEYWYSFGHMPGTDNLVELCTKMNFDRARDEVERFARDQYPEYFTEQKAA